MRGKETNGSHTLHNTKKNYLQVAKIAIFTYSRKSISSKKKWKSRLCIAAEFFPCEMRKNLNPAFVIIEKVYSDPDQLLYSTK